MTDQTKTEGQPAEPRVRMSIATATDAMQRVQNLGPLMEELGFLAGYLAGQETRTVFRTLAKAGKEQALDSWANYRRLVRAMQNEVAIGMQRALVDFDGEPDAVMAAAIEKFPLSSEQFEVSETEAVLGDGRRILTLTRKPVKPEQPIKVTVGR